MKYILNTEYLREYLIRGRVTRRSAYVTQILIMEIIEESCFRSQFALFICRRFREPSRVPVKQLKWFLKKKKLRKRIRNYVSKNLPSSSRVYQIILTPLLRKRVLFGNGERMTEINNNKMMYKTLNHKINNIASKLSGDIETNPGPFVVDPSKTIRASYSQGNSFVFGPNAGKQNKKVYKIK